MNAPLRLARRVPISVRIAAMIAIAFFLLLGAVGAFVYTQTGNAMRTGIDDQLSDAAASLRLPLPQSEDSDDLEEDEEDSDEDDDLFETTGGVQLIDNTGSVFDANGELAEYGPLLTIREVELVRAGRRVEATIPHPEGEGDLRLLVVVLDFDDGQIELDDEADDPEDLIAVLAASLGPVSEAQQALLAVFGPTMVLASVAAGLLGFAIARRSLAPIGKLTAEADAFKASDLKHRLSEPARMDEVGHLARTLNDLLGRLAAAIERERTFTADASHELRTPLAILHTELELMSESLVDLRARAGLESALEECNRLGGLVDDLLLLARGEEGQPLNHRPVDLGDLARSVAARFEGIAAKKGLSVHATGEAVISGDQASLERALANLIDNALRHTNEGGSVIVEVDPREPGAVMRVRDTGKGVPEEDLPHLFDRFYRPDGARGDGGAGLGLAITASVAKSHGGVATATNDPAGGLVVTLSLAHP